VARVNDAVTLEEVLKLARQLSPIDKVRLIERVAPEVERDLATQSRGGSPSLLGLLKDLGPAPSAEEIEAARREAWGPFPRDDI
jgi:hypothetical protein